MIIKITSGQIHRQAVKIGNTLWYWQGNSGLLALNKILLDGSLFAVIVAIHQFKIDIANGKG